MNPTAERYSTVAIALHWITAALMIYMLFFGEDLIRTRGSLAGTNGSLHATLGITVLLLTLARLAWRFVKPSPPEVVGLKRWESLISKAVYVAFYVLLIGLPLTGWLALTPVAAEKGGGETILFFNAIQAVQLPNVGEWVSFVHEVGSKLGIGLLIVHVVAALKHQFYDKMKLLQRMKPF
jgi:cytochrome b561